MIFLSGHLIFDTATTGLLRAVLGEVCESVSHPETGAPSHDSSKILKAPKFSPDGLRQVGHGALSRPHDVAMIGSEGA